MGPVLYFGGGCLFPPHFFPFKFHFDLFPSGFFKCLGLKNVGIHSLFLLCLNNILGGS
jgi:hypothetical protein